MTLPVFHAGKLPEPERAYILKPIDGKLTYVRRGKNVRRDESDAIQQADLYLQGISLQLSSESAKGACLAPCLPACVACSHERGSCMDCEGKVAGCNGRLCYWHVPASAAAACILQQRSAAKSQISQSCTLSLLVPTCL